MSFTLQCGRLCNQIFRNIVTSQLAKKHDLNCKYSSHLLIKKLGIELFSGKKRYRETIEVNDENYFSLLNQEKLEKNINPNKSFFQTKELSSYVYSFLQNSKESIINANCFKERYNCNNDLFIHIRIGDVADLNPGVEYYKQAIELVKSSETINKIYVSTDSPHSKIIIELQRLFPEIIIKNYQPVETIMFGSTCKNIILSHGSFSAIIGYLGFYSKIYYPDYSRTKRIWFGDMFSIENWIKL